MFSLSLQNNNVEWNGHSDRRRFPRECPKCKKTTMVQLGKTEYICHQCNNRSPTVFTKVYAVPVADPHGRSVSKTCPTCCSVPCAMITCAVFNCFTVVAGVFALWLGFSPTAWQDDSAVHLATIAAVAFFPNIVSTSIAGTEAGCARYAGPNGVAHKYCFHDRPHALPAFAGMVSSLVLAVPGFFLAVTTPASCLPPNWARLSGLQPEVNIYCATAGLFLFMAYLLGFVSNVLFIVYFKKCEETTPVKKKAAPPVAKQAAVEMQSVKVQQPDYPEGRVVSY